SPLASSPKTLRERLQRHDPMMTIPASVSVAEQAPGVRIIAVDAGSPADRAGVRNGEILVSINGKGIRDTVDFFFHGAEWKLKLLLLGEDGSERAVTIKKEYPEEHLGLEVEQFVTQNCGCNCVFCFVHQLP